MSEQPKRGQIEELIYNVARSEGASEIEANRLIEIAKCESGLRPDAKNTNSTASGLFQHTRRWSDILGIPHEQFFDPVVSTQAAVDTLRIQGWNAWEQCL